MWFLCDYGTFSDVYVILWEFRTDVWRPPRIHGIGMIAATYMIDISTKWKRTKNIGWYCLFRPSAIDDAKTWYPSTIIFFNRHEGSRKLPKTIKNQIPTSKTIKNHAIAQFFVHLSALPLTMWNLWELMAKPASFRVKRNIGWRP